MATAVLPDSLAAQEMLFYREHPSKWAESRFNIELARYRSEADLASFLEKSQGHAWARSRLANGQLTLDPSRSYQAEALDVLARPIRDGKDFFVHRVAMKYANGIGKTAIAALAILWFIDLFPGGRVVSTAGTWSQLREQLWREINTWRTRATQPIAANLAPMHKTQIDIAPDWSAIGRAASDEATFEGPHADDMLIVVDEAKAVPAGIIENAVRRITRGNMFGRFFVLVLSSPGSPSGTFFDICRGEMARYYDVLSCSAYESQRIPLEQVDQDADEIGEDSPLFVAMDLGEFPDEAEKTLIRLSWVLAAIDRPVDTYQPGPNGELRLVPTKASWRTMGIDVAGRGGDETVLVDLIGRRARIHDRFRGYTQIRQPFVAGKVGDLAGSWGYDQIAVDDVGVGVGLTDLLVTHGWPVRGVLFGEAASKPDRFVNAKSEYYWRVRVELEAGFSNPENPDVGFSLPDDKRLIGELTGVEYDRDDRLRIKVEGHKQMTARNFPSPNTADALVLANAAREGVGEERMIALPDVLPG